MADEQERLRELVADVAAAYFSNSHVTPGDIPNVIAQIASSLSSVGVELPSSESQEPAAAPEPEVTKATPAQIRKSITPDALISFEDGLPYKTLKRHLTTRGLTLEQYRQKWGLPPDYPMVAEAYARQRSELAKALGLGQLRRERAREVARLQQQLRA